MTLLETLIAYFVDKGAVEGPGIDAFIDFMPEEPASVVVFTEYRGDTVSPFTSVVHRSVQIKARDTNAAAARAKAVALCNILKDLPETRRVDFTSSTWGQVYVRQAPFKVSQDTSDRAAYAFNIGVTTNITD